jgi:hypothetical protein
MTKKRILRCLHVPPGVRVPPVEYHCSSQLFDSIYDWIHLRAGLGQPSLLYNGYRSPFPGGKARPGRDADHSPHLGPRS